MTNQVVELNCCKKRAKFWVLSYSKWSHFRRQAVTPTDWSLGSSTGTGARWDSYAALLSCPRCAACSAPLRGSACSSELWRDTSHSTPLLCRDRWDDCIKYIFHYSRDAFKIISKPFDSFVKNRVMRKKLERIALGTDYSIFSKHLTVISCW